MAFHWINKNTILNNCIRFEGFAQSYMRYIKNNVKINSKCSVMDYESLK